MGWRSPTQPYSQAPSQGVTRIRSGTGLEPVAEEFQRNTLQKVNVKQELEVSQPDGVRPSQAAPVGLGKALAGDHDSEDEAPLADGIFHVEGGSQNASEAAQNANLAGFGSQEDAYWENELVGWTL